MSIGLPCFSCCCSVTKSCLTLCNLMDCSMPGSPVFSISQSLFKFMSMVSVMPSNHLIYAIQQLIWNSRPHKSLHTHVYSSFIQKLKAMKMSFSTAKSLQLCLTLCNHMDYSPLGSSVHGILQTRILEWVATPFSRGSPQPRARTWVSCIGGRFFTIWDIREAPSLSADESINTPWYIHTMKWYSVIKNVWTHVSFNFGFLGIQIE